MRHRVICCVNGQLIFWDGQCRHADEHVRQPTCLVPKWSASKEHAHLEDIDGVDVRVAHLDQLPQGRVVLAEVLVLRHLHVDADC